MLRSVIIIFLFCFLFCKNETGWESEVMKTKQTETRSWRNLFAPFAPVQETGQENLSMKQPQTDFKEFSSFVSKFQTLSCSPSLWPEQLSCRLCKASVTVYTLLLRDGHVLKFRRKRQNYMLYPILSSLLFLSPGLVFFFPFFNVHFTQRITGG